MEPAVPGDSDFIHVTGGPIVDAATFSWLAVGILLLAGPLLMCVRDWRWMLGLLAAVYLAAFILVYLHWPISMAVVKLVTGWMGTAVLGMTRLHLAAGGEEQGPFLVEGSAFRLFGAGIVILIAFSVAPSLEAMVPGLEQTVIIGGVLLAGMGLFHLGMTSEYLRVAIGLLSALAGFEILYAAVETSVLVAALLSGANLGLALAGSYLLLQSAPEEEEELSL